LIAFLTRDIHDPVVLPLFVSVTGAASRFEFLEISYEQDMPAATLRAMDYDRFLNTVYWHILREYVLSLSDLKCEICQADHDLQVHHLSYDHHGAEHLYPEDLQVRCVFCHAKEHSTAQRIKPILKALVYAKTPWIHHKPYKPVENPNYDPRVLLELHYYGDVRGKIHE
jgi:hypothetical protein